MTRLALLAIPLFFASGAALACSRVIDDDWTFIDDIKDTDLVFEGVVETSRCRGIAGWMGQRADTGACRAVTDIRVTNAWQGIEAGATVRVMHETNDAICGLRFDPGETVLLRAWHGPLNTQTLYTDMFGEIGHQPAVRETLDASREARASKLRNGR